ncbi:MAG: hypothetical protein FJ164_10685 [Gammaproteobacteria bacterium]|nr:hypothetical protein [Gammaproteobacteria bacterium]
MSKVPAFIQAQRNFARYLRDPLREPLPSGLSGERLEVYRHAVRHNIDRFMADNFPRVRAALTCEAWDEVINSYLRLHPAVTAAFSRLPGEFLAFLSGSHAPATLPLHVHALAHFEWLENSVACDERGVPAHGFDAMGDLLEKPLIINPIHQLVSYDYPIHVITSDTPGMPLPARETHLVVFRDSAHQLQLLELNPVTRALFERLGDAEEVSAREILADIATSLRHPAPEVVLRGGLDILQRMRHRGLVLGTRTA